jgi:2',3'-cyclic-nucleotide 2'-phosphodiesterase (5'-nucleotidase family)
MAKAIYDQAIKEGYDDICLSYVNVARNGLPSGSWTYADLYQSFPFDNMVYIAEIKGSEFLYEIVNYNFIYRNPAFTEDTIDPNGTYKIALLDYLYFHTNSSRYYDYFKTTGGVSTTHLNDNYRVILKNWLKENGYNTGKLLNPSDFASKLWQHNRTVFHE